MLPNNFTYESPDSLDQALNRLMTKEDVILLAGGTDLIPLMKIGVKRPSCLLDLKKIRSLKSIEMRKEGLFIGSMATLDEIGRHPMINRFLPALGHSARSVASPQIRNQATIGGNLFQERRCFYYNQSEHWRKTLSPCFKSGGAVCHQVAGSKTCRALYYSDTAPVLLASDAQAEIFDQKGFGILPLREVIHRHVTDGSEKLLLTGVLIPILPAGAWVEFFRYSLRAAIDFPTVNAAIRFSPAPERGQ
ncbi:MAG: hypothetical protein EHM36_08540, partial [Deltaproteobacteria bacterium]